MPKHQISDMPINGIKKVACKLTPTYMQKVGKPAMLKCNLSTSKEYNKQVRHKFPFNLTSLIPRICFSIPRNFIQFIFYYFLLLFIHSIIRHSYNNNNKTTVRYNTIQFQEMEYVFLLATVRETTRRK